ncbi:hypothetical protein PG988_015898 [Apiospora saccharicola]
MSFMLRPMARWAIPTPLGSEDTMSWEKACAPNPYVRIWVQAEPARLDGRERHGDPVVSEERLSGFAVDGH